MLGPFASLHTNKHGPVTELGWRKCLSVYKNRPNACVHLCVKTAVHMCRTCIEKRVTYIWNLLLHLLNKRNPSKFTSLKVCDSRWCIMWILLWTVPMFVSTWCQKRLKCWASFCHAIEIQNLLSWISSGYYIQQDVTFTFEMLSISSRPSSQIM
jgi:hypothetical protein